MGVGMIGEIVAAMAGRTLTTAIIWLVVAVDNWPVGHGDDVGEVDRHYGAQFSSGCVVTGGAGIMDFVVDRVDRHAVVRSRASGSGGMTGGGATLDAKGDYIGMVGLAVIGKQMDAMAVRAVDRRHFALRGDHLANQVAS